MASIPKAMVWLPMDSLGFAESDASDDIELIVRELITVCPLSFWMKKSILSVQFDAYLECMD